MTPSECARSLAQPFGVGVTNDSFVVARGDQRVRITVDSNSGTIHGVVVTAFGKPLPAIAFTRESSFDRLGKTTRIAREAQLGDPSFDPHVYIDSTLDDARIGRLLASPGARSAVVALLKDCDKIEFGETGIAATTMNEAVFVGDAKRLAAHVERLFALYATLPTDAASMRSGQRVSREMMIGLLVVGSLVFSVSFTAVLLMFGSAGLFSPFTLAGLGVVLSIASWIVVTPIAALVLSGRSKSFRDFTGFAITTFFLLLPAGPIALCVANQRLDTSSIRDHRMPIRNAYMESSDDDEQLFVEFVSPIDPNETVTIGFEGAMVPPPGTVVYIRTRDGGLGYPYRLEAHYGP